MHPFEICPTLFRRRWPRTGLSDAIANINWESISQEIAQLRQSAPSRKAAGKAYFSDKRTGTPASVSHSNRVEELTAISMFNLNRRWPVPDGGWLQFIDYQTPLKARMSDKGIGKIDLLGLTGTGRVAVIELKAANRSGTFPDSPISALMEALSYSVLVDANGDDFRGEIQDKFRRPVSALRPIMVILAPVSWWRSWLDTAAAGDWWAPYNQLIQRIEKETGIKSALLAFDDVDLIPKEPGQAPQLAALPKIYEVSPAALKNLSHPAPANPDEYLNTLNQTFWDWARALPKGALDGIERENRPPVAAADRPEISLILSPVSHLAEKTINVIPVKDRHRHFGSFRSSQALAQSVFGAIKIYGRLEILESMRADCGRPAFTSAKGAELILEYEVETLSEPRPTSVDVLMTGTNYRVAIECKLTEQEFGGCSRTKNPQDSPSFCDGTFSLQKNRDSRCALSEQGIAYWDHLPSLFNWQNDRDHRPCPFKDGYQIARNALAATVWKAGELKANGGHVLVVYDARNPAFEPGGRADEQFERVSAASLTPGLVRRISWQTITGHLAEAADLNWLADGLKRKYGFAGSL